MKTKAMLITIVLLWAVSLYAVTTITYNIPDDEGVKFLAAYIAQSNAHVNISIRGSQNAADPNVPDYSATIDFRTPVYDANVPNAAFVKRRTALFASALNQDHKAKLAQETKKAYLDLAPVVDVNEPDPNDMG